MIMRKNYSGISIILLLLCIGVWGITNVVYAADGAFVPLAETPSGPLGDLYDTQSGDLSSFVNGLFKFAIIIGAIGAVLRIAYAGYLYMGSDMWSNKGAAKEILGDVTLGLLLLLSIWVILYQINPQILSLGALNLSATTNGNALQSQENDLYGYYPQKPFSAQKVDPSSSGGKWCTETPNGPSCFTGANGQASCQTLASQMKDEALGYYEPRPWHEDRPQRPKDWLGHNAPRNKWIPSAP